MYGDVAVAHMKYRWQCIIDELAKQPYIKREIVIDDLVENLKSKPVWTFNNPNAAERKYYKSLVLMALLDVIDDYHAFIGMIDLRQDLNIVIDITNEYRKTKQNIASDEIKCPECNGHGQFGFTDEDGLQTWDCLACQGSGWIPSDPAKCIGFALCQHCAVRREIDFSQRDNDRAFADYCNLRRERVKPPKDTTEWCPKFSPKTPMPDSREKAKS